MTSNSRNKEEPIEDEHEEWIVMARQKGRQTNSIQTKLHFHQKHSKGSISHKNKGKRNKKMSKPRPIKGKDEDFLRPRWLITLTEFFPRSFLEDHPKEILEVTTCHTVSIVEVDNNYVSSKEVDNSNEIKQKTSVFDRIKPSTTRSSVFQRLSMATKEEENQCPTSTSTRTSAFKRLSISTSKKDQPSTYVFYRLKMTNDPQREMKILKTKIFHEENNDDGKIHSRVPSRMKRKLSIDISAASPLFKMLTSELYSSPICCRRGSFHVLQPRGSSSSSSHMCCSREDCHLKYVALRRSSSPIGCIKRMIISNMLQPRRSSSQICCSQEDHRLNRDGRHLKYVTTEKIIVLNMLQSRRASSSFPHMCCSRGDQHLHHHAAQAIIIFNATQAIIIFNAARAIIIFNVEQRRRSSSSMQRNANDHHFQ
ncbi:retrotransposon gag protein [Cucumis melo var. makuwa]|uniref:Retrotransposon gag protein n=1 Tax=Cucumis melo var. makuwa TaxID=1194695 RepID=A0A5A7U2K7_CUCMM|nr:retrotransposon gag protein [Cucumis melo var. makuwa]TYK06400.1 retrotransposon gag protein [Cucumis melo var. makuwa]